MIFAIFKVVSLDYMFSAIAVFSTLPSLIVGCRGGWRLIFNFWTGFPHGKWNMEKNLYYSNYCVPKRLWRGEYFRESIVILSHFSHLALLYI